LVLPRHETEHFQLAVQAAEVVDPEGGDCVNWKRWGNCNTAYADALTPAFTIWQAAIK
jgi:hypothetical protein